MVGRSVKKKSGTRDVFRVIIKAHECHVADQCPVSWLPTGRYLCFAVRIEWPDAVDCDIADPDPEYLVFRLNADKDISVTMGREFESIEYFAEIVFDSLEESYIGDQVCALGCNPEQFVYIMKDYLNRMLGPFLIRILERHSCKYFGSKIVVLESVDTIVFTANYATV